MDMQVPPPGPPWLTDHFLDWVYRQQTSWLEPGCIKVPISGFLNFTKLERKQMLFYGNGWYVVIAWGGNSGPCWGATGKTLLCTQYGARTASFSGMQMVRATEAHGSFVASAPQLAAQSLIEQCEVRWSSCVLGCTLQYHCVTNAPSRGSGYHFPGDPETTTKRWYSRICIRWTHSINKEQQKENL